MHLNFMKLADLKRRILFREADASDHGAVIHRNSVLVFAAFELSGLMLMVVVGIYLSVESMPALSRPIEKRDHLAMNSNIHPANDRPIPTIPAPTLPEPGLKTLTAGELLFETKLSALSLGSALQPSVPVAKLDRQKKQQQRSLDDSLNQPLQGMDSDMSKMASETTSEPASIEGADIEKIVLAENSPEKLTQEKLTQDKRSSRKTIDRTAKIISPLQEADYFYHQALMHLREGRIAEAQTNLARALEINPKQHEARQTLAALLLDNKRINEAATVLSEGLKISPERFEFSIALARIQLESMGATEALQTLEQAAAYAGNSAEYHGFLALLLQRVERNKEAIEHYRIALAQDPLNVSWLIGLGISLQANDQFTDAREVFKRVQTIDSLSAELAAFVDQRLKELGHQQG